MALKMKGGGYLRNAPQDVDDMLVRTRALRDAVIDAGPNAKMDDIIAAFFPDEKPIAFMFGLPMNAREALAYMAYEAGTHTDEQHDILVAWRVKMTLVHGTWRGDELAFLQK